MPTGFGFKPKDYFYICCGCGRRKRVKKNKWYHWNLSNKRQSKNSFVGVCPSCEEKGVKLRE